MPVITEDRPLETVRNEVIDQLIINYGHGELSREAFERRLDDAMETQQHAELLRLTEDLELRADPRFAAQRQQATATKVAPDSDRGVDYIVNVFGGSDVNVQGTLAREIRMVGVFSGSNIDLSEASYPTGSVKIRLYSVFSGTDVYVPEGVNVSTRVFCIFGGVDNRIVSAFDPNSPTITIEGFAIFSGIDIKIRQTIREKLVSFAERWKSLWRDDSNNSNWH